MFEEAWDKLEGKIVSRDNYGKDNHRKRGTSTNDDGKVVYEGIRNVESS